MKILLANKFYYRRGGDCIVTMGLEDLLKSHGHEVAIFAMDYPENVESPWKRYWPSNMSKVKAFTRPFGDGEVKAKFNQLLDDFFGSVDPDWGDKTKTIKTPEVSVSNCESEIVSELPSSATQSSIGSYAASIKPSGKKHEKQPSGQYDDCVVHLHNIHTQLSPVIAEIAHKRGIKVVWTLHDTKLVCPAYTCMRTFSNSPLKGENKMQWCEECFMDKKSVIKHKCMPGGIVGSTIGYFEIMKWNKDRLQACTDKFLPPSKFMMDTCVDGGYDPEKFQVLCNFIDVNKVANPNFDKGDYYCYLGRVTEVKGIRTLCEAASQLPYKLKVIGGGDLLDELKTKYPDVEFLGQKDWSEFRPVLEGAKFMVLPSEWSENNPLTVIESQSLGTPVLGARIGGIPELIVEGISGMTFTSGDVQDLKSKIEAMWGAEFDYEAIAKKAVERYSSETYYEKLMEIYND